MVVVIQNWHSNYGMTSGKGFWRATGDSMRSWLSGEEYGNSLGNEELLDEGLESQRKERERVTTNISKSKWKFGVRVGNNLGPRVLKHSKNIKIKSFGLDKDQLWATKCFIFMFSVSIQSRSYVQLCDPMDWSTPDFLFHHQLPELTQTHVHWVCDAIQPSHPLSSPSPPTFHLPQHQDLFYWVSSSHQVAKVLEFQLQHPSFQWIFRTDFL